MSNPPSSPPNTCGLPPLGPVPLPAASSWTENELIRLHILRGRFTNNTMFFAFPLPNELSIRAKEALSESTRTLKITWEWEFPGDKTISQDLFTALAWKIYGHSAGMDLTSTRHAPEVPQVSSICGSSEFSWSPSPTVSSSTHSSFHLTSSQIIQDAHQEVLDLDCAVQGEPQSEHILHSFIRTCLRLLYRFYGAGDYAMQVDSRHLYCRSNPVCAINDGSVVWMAKTNTSDGGIDEIEIPPMVALEAKPGFTGVPPQHVAELLVMILARVDRWMGDDNVVPLEESLPAGFLIGYGVVMAGTHVFFTKLVSTWKYVLWLRKGGEDTCTESARFTVTQRRDLANEDERIEAGNMALRMLAILHRDWVEEVKKIAAEHEVTWEMDLEDVY